VRQNRAVTRIPERLTALARAWLERLVALGFVERSVALGSYAFTALIPLLVVYGALASPLGAAGFADRLSDRFRLTGSAAASVHQAFAPPGDVTQSITVLSIVLLIASALTLTRGLQRLYQNAYGLPSLGVRGMVWGLAWLALVPVFLEFRTLEASVLDGLIEAAITLGLAAVCWTLSPYLLLGRRLGWRVLLPGGLLTAAGMSALAVGSILYMPRSVGSSASQYGVIGVAFALMGWLVACGFVLVGTAAAGAVIVGRSPEPGAS
jgi:membrane protein